MAQSSVLFAAFLVHLDTFNYIFNIIHMLFHDDDDDDNDRSDPHKMIAELDTLGDLRLNSNGTGDINQQNVLCIRSRSIGTDLGKYNNTST